MTNEQIFAMVDHTLLAQTATWEQIRAICDDALRFHTASVCIPPCYVRAAKEYLGERMKVCTVIGFPNGNHTTAAKVFETKDALENGGEIPLHTLQGWNLRGSYRVKSGEEGISVKLWRKRENEDRFYLARAYLYRFEQLEES